MRMNAILIVVVLLVSLGSCGGIFDSNVFSSLENTSYDIDPRTTTLGDLTDMAQSPTFFAALESDQTGEKKAAVLSILNETLVSESSSPEDRQAAALLKAEVVLQTSPSADETINNITEVLFNLDSYSGLTSETDGDAVIRQVLQDILPASSVPPVQASAEQLASAQASFVEVISALSAAGDAYITFGETLVPQADGTIKAPAGVDMGSITQEAVVSIMVNRVISSVVSGDRNADGDNDRTDKILAVYGLLFGDDTSIELSVGDSSADTYSPFSELIHSFIPLGNIIEASGVDPSLFEIPGTSASGTV